MSMFLLVPVQQMIERELHDVWGECQSYFVNLQTSLKSAMPTKGTSDSDKANPFLKGPPLFTQVSSMLADLQNLCQQTDPAAGSYGRAQDLFHNVQSKVLEMNTIWRECETRTADLEKKLKQPDSQESPKRFAAGRNLFDSVLSMLVQLRETWKRYDEPEVAFTTATTKLQGLKKQLETTSSQQDKAACLKSLTEFKQYVDGLPTEGLSTVLKESGMGPFLTHNLKKSAMPEVARMATSLATSLKKRARDDHA